MGNGFASPHYTIIKKVNIRVQLEKSVVYYTSMHVVVVGQVCIDKNVTENAEYTAAGGPPIFMGKVFSQIPGIITINIAPYGKDFLPFAKNLPLFPKKPTTEKTLIYQNVMEGTTRKQKAFNRELATPIPLGPEVQKMLATADILFFAPLLPNIDPAYVETVVNATNKHALKIILPQGYYRGFTPDDIMYIRDFVEEQQVLPLFDMVIVSDQDGENMLTTAEFWAEKYGVTSIVTLGENGAVAIEGNTTTDLPTTPVPANKVIDSIGSGEIFSASLAYAYKKTGDLRKAGKFANAVAASCLFYTSDAIRVDTSLLKLLK